MDHTAPASEAHENAVVGGIFAMSVAARLHSCCMLPGCEEIRLNDQGFNTHTIVYGPPSLLPVFRRRRLICRRLWFEPACPPPAVGTSGPHILLYKYGISQALLRPLLRSNRLPILPITLLLYFIFQSLFVRDIESLEHVDE